MAHPDGKDDRDPHRRPIPLQPPTVNVDIQAWDPERHFLVLTQHGARQDLFDRLIAERVGYTPGDPILDGIYGPKVPETNPRVLKYIADTEREKALWKARRKLRKKLDRLGPRDPIRERAISDLSQVESELAQLRVEGEQPLE